MARVTTTSTATLAPFRSAGRLWAAVRSRTHAHGTATAASDEERAEGAPSLAASSHVEATPNLKHGDGSLLDDSLSLARNDIFTINVLGYAAYTFVIGAYAYWAPKAMREIFHEERADALFGGITVVTGMGGTLFGGLMLDRMGATIPNALLVCMHASRLCGLFDSELTVRVFTSPFVYCLCCCLPPPALSHPSPASRPPTLPCLPSTPHAHRTRWATGASAWGYSLPCPDQHSLTLPPCHPFPPMPPPRPPIPSLLPLPCLLPPMRTGHGGQLAHQHGDIHCRAAACRCLMGSW
ncbi:unnamed protein product [Closterium sp. NIES-54]